MAKKIIKVLAWIMFYGSCGFIGCLFGLGFGEVLEYIDKH